MNSLQNVASMSVLGQVTGIRLNRDYNLPSFNLIRTPDNGCYVKHCVAVAKALFLVAPFAILALVVLCASFDALRAYWRAK